MCVCVCEKRDGIESLLFNFSLNISSKEKPEPVWFPGPILPLSSFACRISDYFCKKSLQEKKGKKLNLQNLAKL